MISSIGLITQLFTLHARLGQTMFCFALLENYIFISDQTVKAKSNRNRHCMFSFLWEPKDRTLDHFFHASHIRHNFPYKYKLIPIPKYFFLYLYRNISEVISENSTSPFNYWDDFSSNSGGKCNAMR